MGAQMFLDEYEVGMSWVHNPVSCSPVQTQSHNAIYACFHTLVNIFPGGAIRSTEVPNRPV